MEPLLTTSRPAVSGPQTILAIETSCDETAVAVLAGGRELLASEVASQIALHRPHGGVVPEVASRRHLQCIRPLLLSALEKSGCTLPQIDAFAATSGPGLAGALLVGLATAKGLAIGTGKPFLAVNHLEGHLFSPFFGYATIPPCTGLVVSGGHTLLVDVRGPGEVRVLGRTRDDAAGEAFDKVGKLLGLPYPGGPEIDRWAERGDPARFDFPRSMLGGDGLEFSFSGLKTSVRYLLEKLAGPGAGPVPWREDPVLLADLCASFQEAVVDVLVAKSMRAVRQSGRDILAASGGVTCNRRLRGALAEACRGAGVRLLLSDPALATDNAAMIAYAASLRLRVGETTPLERDIDPGLGL